MASSAKATDYKAPQESKFFEDEKVLCFQGPLIYAAKCLQTRQGEESKNPEYLVHYSGWSKSWDEWVPESRVLKFNDANLQKQKDLHKAQKNEPKNKKNRKRSVGGPDTPGGPDTRSSTPVNDKEKPSAKAAAAAALVKQSSSQESTDDEPTKKKVKIEFADEAEGRFLLKVDMKVKFPDELKPWLTDDWDLISRQKMLVRLPARVTVDRILDDYYQLKTSGKSFTRQQEAALLEVMVGFKDYFNVLLGVRLLYKFERIQLGRLMKEYPDTPFTEIYGANHLLRMFFKMEGAFADASLKENTAQLLLVHIYDFLKYMPFCEFSLAADNAYDKISQ